jgi:2-C-methyl-D-erythritol 4-phosphate cytidylyltransferase
MAAMDQRSIHTTDASRIDIISNRAAVAGIILAAGASTRLGVDKLWEDLGGRPLLAWSIQVFADSPIIDQIVVVTRAETTTRVRELLDAMQLTDAVQLATGGAERQDSVRAGLQAVADAKWVVVHDAARPFVTDEIIERGLAESRTTGAAIAAVPVVDTVKIVDYGTIMGTPDRQTLWAAQTPQIFRRELLWEAHQRASHTATDDAALVEAIGTPVRVFMGAYRNLKVTTDVDLQLARLLAAQPTAAPSTLASHMNSESPRPERE